MNRFILLLIAIIISATSQPLLAAVDYKAEGKRLCQLGQYEEAIPYLEKAVKQNRKSGALWYLAIARQHLYQFDEAIDALETYQTVLNSDEWITRADSLLSVLRICSRAYEHTEDVVIIDSMQVDKADFFTHYRLGAESGRIQHSEELGIYFENQAGDYRLTTDGSRFYDCHRFQGKWEEAHPLPGIGTEDFELTYPFMRSDGETIYFACDSTPGMGGFDIYRTSYNSEDGTYYMPERLGMPFNSPYNDYMMAIDETHQVGWWATDRSAPAGQVTIYLFLLESDPEYLDEPTISRARIDDIRESWREEEGYAELLREVMEAPQTPVIEVPKLHIVINDDKVYASVDDFRNPSARAAYLEYEQLAEKLKTLEDALAQTRLEYARANASQKQQLASRILKAEESLFTYYAQLREAELKYRRLEQ